MSYETVLLPKFSPGGKIILWVGVMGGVDVEIPGSVFSK